MRAQRETTINANERNALKLALLAGISTGTLFGGFYYYYINNISSCEVMSGNASCYNSDCRDKILSICQGAFDHLGKITSISSAFFIPIGFSINILNQRSYRLRELADKMLATKRVIRYTNEISHSESRLFTTCKWAYKALVTTSVGLISVTQLIASLPTKGNKEKLQDFALSCVDQPRWCANFSSSPVLDDIWEKSLAATNWKEKVTTIGVIGSIFALTVLLSFKLHRDAQSYHRKAEEKVSRTVIHSSPRKQALVTCTIDLRACVAIQNLESVSPVARVVNHLSRSSISVNNFPEEVLINNYPPSDGQFSEVKEG